MEKPHVTICVPAYNAARTIGRTLDSLLAQDYSNYDVLVCDNLSSDDTAKIVKTYENRGVRYFLNSVQEKWCENNWNHALSLAEGPLIALYHADDLYTPTMVRKQAEFMQAHTETSAVFTMTRMIDGEDRPIRMGSTRLPEELRGRECFKFNELFRDVLKYGNFMTVPTLMTKREALNAVGVFDLRFRSAADIDLWLRLSRWGPVVVIDEPLHRYRISAEQVSAKIHRTRVGIADFFRVLDDYLTRPEVVQIVDPDALAYYEMDRAVDMVFCAMNLLVQGDTVKAMERLNEALRWRYFRTACRRPLRLLRLMGGAGLWAMGSLGAGALAGRCLYRVYQSVQRWRRQRIA